MPGSSQSPKVRSVNLISGALGGVIAYLATLLPDGILKQTLIISTPAISILLGITVFPSIAYIYNSFSEGKYARHLHKTKNELDIALSNPKTSETHKETLRLELEKIEIVDFKRKVQVIENKRIVTGDDIISRIQGGTDQVENVDE